MQLKRHGERSSAHLMIAVLTLILLGRFSGGNLGAYRGWELILAVDGQVVVFGQSRGMAPRKRRVTPHHAGSLAWDRASQRVPRCGTTISFSTPNDPGTSRARNPAAILSDS